MLSFEEMGAMLDELARELPGEILRELNGGIGLSPDVKLHPEARTRDLYTMGEYCHRHDMGRYILLYYGSFVRVFGQLSPEAQREEMRKILHHELTHHLESMAGARDLEFWDERELERYRRGTDR